MKKYVKAKKLTDGKADGFVVVEKPHQGQRVIWAAYDYTDFIKKAREANPRKADLEEYDLSEYHDVLRLIGDDLAGLNVYEPEAITEAWIEMSCDEMLNCAASLGWIEAVEFDEGAIK